jgi:hypothetical protein
MRHGAKSFKVAHCGFESHPDIDQLLDSDSIVTTIGISESPRMVHKKYLLKSLEFIYNTYIFDVSN